MAAPRLFVDLQTVQNHPMRERGIPRYATGHARALVRHGAVVEALALNPLLPFPTELHPELAAAPELTWNTAARWRVAIGRGPTAYHIMSPFESLTAARAVLPAHIMAGPAPVVYTVYDLIPEILRLFRDAPHIEQFMRLRSRSLAAADLLLCISESTRRDVLERLGVDEDRVVVIGAAADERFVPPGPLDRPAELVRSVVPGLVDRFVLAVAGNERHKNSEGLIDAFAPTASRRPHRASAGDRVPAACLRRGDPGRSVPGAGFDTRPGRGLHRLCSRSCPASHVPGGRALRVPIVVRGIRSSRPGSGPLPLSVHHLGQVLTARGAVLSPGHVRRPTRRPWRPRSTGGSPMSHSDPNWSQRAIVPSCITAGTRWPAARSLPWSAWRPSSAGSPPVPHRCASPSPARGHRCRRRSSRLSPSEPSSSASKRGPRRPTPLDPVPTHCRPLDARSTQPPTTWFSTWSTISQPRLTSGGWPWRFLAWCGFRRSTWWSSIWPPLAPRDGPSPTCPRSPGGWRVGLKAAGPPYTDEDIRFFCAERNVRLTGELALSARSCVVASSAAAHALRLDAGPFGAPPRSMSCARPTPAGGRGPRPSTGRRSCCTARRPGWSSWSAECRRAGGPAGSLRSPKTGPASLRPTNGVVSSGPSPGSAQVTEHPWQRCMETPLASWNWAISSGDAEWRGTLLALGSGAAVVTDLAAAADLPPGSVRLLLPAPPQAPSSAPSVSSSSTPNGSTRWRRPGRAGHGGCHQVTPPPLAGGPHLPFPLTTAELTVCERPVNRRRRAGAAHGAPKRTPRRSRISVPDRCASERRDHAQGGRADEGGRRAPPHDEQPHTSGAEDTHLPEVLQGGGEGNGRPRDGAHGGRTGTRQKGLGGLVGA